MLTDELRAKFQAVVSAVKSRAGAPPVLSDRDFVEATLYLARTGCPCRYLPSRFGKWDAVYDGFSLLAENWPVRP